MNEELLSYPLSDVPFVVFDVETTGLHASYNNIIEIGMVKVINGKIIDKYSTLINPGRYIPPFITSLTGISDKDLYDAPFFDEVMNDILKFLHGSVLTAHNLQFDLSFLRKEFRVNGLTTFSPLQLCTLKLARRLYPKLKNRSLGQLAAHLEIPHRDAHRALGDALTTAKILMHFIKNLEEENDVLSLEELLLIQYQPINEEKVKVKRSFNKDLAVLPQAPGVYMFLNSKNEIIYIGKAKSLRERIKSYLAVSSPNKSKKILRYARRIKTIITNTELIAMLAESELIKQVKPKYNVMLKGYPNKYFLKINRDEPFPRPIISNNFSFDGNDYFGLFVTKRKANELLELIDHIFLLRECEDKEFLKEQKCYLADIERCTSPCVNKDVSLYENELIKVFEFMHGENNFALNRMIKKMKNFSEQQKYEKAAEVKSLIDLILAQIQKTSLLAEPVNKAKVVFEIKGETNVKDYILLIEGKVFIKEYFIDEKSFFDEKLVEYYNKTINSFTPPDEEDLEKLKVILNWIIRNRKNVKIYYLDNYKNFEELIASFERNNNSEIEPETIFEVDKLKELLNMNT